MASALDWLKQTTSEQQIAPEYDAFGNMTVPGSTAQGSNIDDVLYGSINSTGQTPAFKATLQQISDAAGLQGFDWTPYAAAAAQQNLQQTNQLGYHFTSDWGQALSGIVAAAAADNPQIGQVWQASGPQLAQQWSQQGSQLLQEQQASRDKNKQARLMMMAAPFGAGALSALAGGAGAAGAASEGAALAGSASTPSMAAGAGGALGTVPSGLGAYYSGGAGITAAEEAAMLGASGGGSAGGAAAGGSALQNIIGGSGGTSDWLKLAGQVAPGILGMIGSNQQTKAMEGLAGQYMAMGQPYRDKALSYENNPELFYNSPEAQGALNATLRKLSATQGNVAGSPYAQALTMDAMYDNFSQNQQRLGNMGGLSAYNSAAPGASQSAINSGANQWNAFGSAAGNVLNPPTPLAELYKQYRTAAGMY